jgi:hypothetical protein
MAERAESSGTFVNQSVKSSSEMNGEKVKDKVKLAVVGRIGNVGMKVVTVKVDGLPVEQPENSVDHSRK